MKKILIDFYKTESVIVKMNIVILMVFVKKCKEVFKQISSPQKKKIIYYLSNFPKKLIKYSRKNYKIISNFKFMNLIIIKLIIK